MKFTVSRRSLSSLSRIAKDDVERRNYASLDAAFRRLINVSQHLEILIHEFHYGWGGSFDALANLVEPRAAKQAQFLDGKARRQIGRRLHAPFKRGALSNQLLLQS